MNPSLQLPWLSPAAVNQQLRDHYWATLILAVLSYLAAVQLLRFRNVRKMRATYASYLHDPYTMNYKTAHEILNISMLREFPWMFFFGTTWALVKTYGIASGTPLLVQTGQLSSPATVGKRAEDTGVFIQVFVVGSVDSERGLRALSKVNWLHRRYGAKIGNEEMIHTLAMFVLEPQKWIERYEWRAMTELEKVAAFVYWKEIGNRMGIKDIPGTLTELENWTEKFEEKHMVYCESNRICTESTVNLYLRNVPGFLKNSVRILVASLLEERVRIATGTPEPPWWAPRLVKSILCLRGWFIGNFFLPRWHEKDVMSRPGVDGRLQRDLYAFEPWYVKSTWWKKLLTRVETMGNLQPGPQFKETGYLPEELGPVEFEKASKDPVLKQAEAMSMYAARGGASGVGCPFAFGGS
jgi:hypothetical protein